MCKRGDGYGDWSERTKTTTIAIATTTIAIITTRMRANKINGVQQFVL
jgi:hypothetical protein